MPGTGLYDVKAAPTKLDRTQSGPPVGQVITMTTGGLGTAAAYAGGYVENMTRVEVRATVSHTDDALTLAGNLANWLDTDDLDVYDSWDVIQDACDQLSTDQAAAEFTATQELRLYDGTYTEKITLNAALRPTHRYKLKVNAADGNTAVIVTNNGLGVGHTWNLANVDNVSFVSISIKNTHVNMYCITGTASAGTFIDGCSIEGTVAVAKGILVNGFTCRDTVFTGQHNLVIPVAGIFTRCEFHGGIIQTYAEHSPVTFRACVFDGTYINIKGDVALNSPSSSGPQLFNCTIYNVATFLVGILGHRLDCRVLNCIFHTVSGYVFNADQGTGRIASDRNVFYNCTKIGRMNGTDYATLADWQAFADEDGSSPDANSFEADPLLADPANDDYSLGSASPCRKAGHGSAVLTDYLGVAFDAHYPDIGAWSGTETITSPTWPATLPQTVDQSQFQEGFADVVERSEMESGPAKVRRRFTGGTQPFSATMTLTTAQVATLQTFHDATLQGGALTFQWTHPRTGAAAEMRFVAPPTITQRGAVDWVASLSLEMLP